ncbi:Holliday junction branch migration protein RuvA [Cyanobium gracile]|uniref:Holliday junction branch migration complex subunit RuvA n=1 Tax=Cyanobium gracile UHCC 0281 TaxID=3110309 RepID=A0ABU5SR19_9CYAN|nr:Holliday junction branch migration protein RuvA [Cyanobium gracile]MEA5440948.1 Holliday junction branch migration protein RuvA [Cyanobium gracile UHCC 0281]
MIGWLQGRLAEPWQQANRCGALLICQGVGYEVQFTLKQWQRLPEVGSDLGLHVHHSIRDDGWTLYGFIARQERDLFRELVAVSGVGPQMALGLLGALDVPDLVRAIVHADLRSLCLAPGVGKRTAERLTVELRARLQERFAGLVDPLDEGEVPDADPPGGPTAPCREEVQITLVALGYEPLEIHRALRAVAAAGIEASAGADDWIRESLRWLSRAVA